MLVIAAADMSRNCPSGMQPRAAAGRLRRVAVAVPGSHASSSAGVVPRSGRDPPRAAKPVEDLDARWQTRFRGIRALWAPRAREDDYPLATAASGRLATRVAAESFLVPSTPPLAPAGRRGRECSPLHREGARTRYLGGDSLVALVGSWSSFDLASGLSGGGRRNRRHHVPTRA